jgi:glyoxylase-like metal-dependent hydrolase (beta-lactamase superfamily II)
VTVPQSRQLGDFHLTLLSDGVYFLDGGAFFGIIPKALWEKRMPADAANRVPVGLNSVLIETGKHNILVETGIGNKLGDKMKQIYQPQEKLLQELAAAGKKPEQIDVVINTHLHFDHSGWNTVLQNGTAVATFPNAQYYAPLGEWEAARMQRERDRVSYLTDNYDPLIRSGQMQLLERDQEILPGVSMHTYSGHTRAMMAVKIANRGETACYISDLIPTTAHTDLAWAMAFDLYPLETIENKKRFYKEAIPGKWLVIFTHDPAKPWGYVQEVASGRFGFAEP